MAKLKLDREELKEQIKVLQQEKQIAELSYQKSQYELAQKYTSQLVESTYVKDDFLPLTNGSLLDKKEPEQSTYEQLRKQSIRMYYKNAHYRGIIENMINYIVGMGIRIIPLDDNKEYFKYWEKFWNVNKMNKRIREIVRRDLRDGEVFCRFFGLGQPDDVPKLRFIDPDLIDDPQKRCTYGIETEDGDVEDIVAYYQKNPITQQADYIPSEEIIHDKICVDSNVKRGRPLCEVDFPYFGQHDKWLQARVVLSVIRTSVAIVKTVDGDSSDVTRIRDAQLSTKSSDVDNKLKMVKFGTVFHANPGVKYEFLSPKLDARDAAQDGRNILLCVAAGHNMPEYMVTGDSSNANYSNSLISESPAIRMYTSWQMYFAELFTEIYQKVMNDAVESGKLPKTFKKDDVVPFKHKVFAESEKIYQLKDGEMEVSYRCAIDFPELVGRDFTAQVEGWSALKDKNVISEDTLANKFDVNLDEEYIKMNLREKKKKEYGIKDPVLPTDKTIKEPKTKKDDKTGKV